jgi:hypothetical protein
VDEQRSMNGGGDGWPWMNGGVASEGAETEPQPERMNSPLENHEVRLRGLVRRGKVRRAGRSTDPGE